jgi:hypothetical protein
LHLEPPFLVKYRLCLKNNLLKIWKTRGQIFQGIKNKVFKREHVEEIAEHRMSICRECSLYDEKGEGCIISGTQPCCNEKKGGCGCSLAFKTRSLASECPFKKWRAELTEEEEDQLNQQLGI